MEQMVRDKRTGLLLLSEECRDRNSPLWHADISGTAAIWVRDTDKLGVCAHVQGDSVVWARYAFQHLPHTAALEDEIRNTEERLLNASTKFSNQEAKTK